jgi:hypothetical protein
MRDFWTTLLREGEGVAGAGDAGGSSPPGSAPPAAGAGEAGGDASGDKPPASPRGSIYDDAGLDEPGKEGSTTWPADWRDQFVKDIADPTEREKALNQMSRYQSPAEVAKANLAMRQRISSGEYKRDLPPDATEEQIKEWRAERGLPEDPTGYEIPLGDGVKFEEMSDTQKAVYQGWQELFHKTNATPEQAKAYGEYMQDMIEAQAEALAEHDAQKAETLEDTLRTEWGPEYRPNLKLNDAFLKNALGDEMAVEWGNARLPDGTALKHHPAIAKMINDMARASGLSSGFESGEVMTGSSLLDKKAEIEKLLSTNLAEYNKRKPEYEAILDKLSAQGVIDAMGNVIKK